MGVFHDNLASWKGEDGAVSLPEDYETSLTAAYDADFSAATDGSNAKISELTEALTAKDAELTAAKAANWDLLQSIPTDEGADSDPTNSQNQDEPEDSPADFDDFFSN